MPESNSQPALSPQPPLKLDEKEVIAAGSTGVVYALDDDHALKEFYDEEDLRKEEQALQQIGRHPSVVGYFGRASDAGLLLERGEPLRLLLLRNTSSSISWERKLRWIEDAAAGVQHLHRQEVVHADIGCHNMIVVNDRVKLVDFEGCSFSGKPATAAYEWFSSPKPSAEISRQTDMFAFGCAAYEIVSGKVPYADLEDQPDRLRLASERYERRQWPGIADDTIREIVYGCWAWKYGSMDEILEILRSGRQSIRTQTWQEKLQTLLAAASCGLLVRSQQESDESSVKRPQT